MKSWRCLTLALALSAFASRADSAVIVTVTESNGDVVFSAGGTLNLAGLSRSTGGDASVGLYYYGPTGVFWTLGANPLTRLPFDRYDGLTRIGDNFLSLPSTFFFASLGTGARFGIDEGSGASLLVPSGFTGGTISATAVFASTNFAELGIVPGSYRWEWGSETNADSVTMNIGVNDVPEPATFPCMGLAVACLMLIRRHARV